MISITKIISFGFTTTFLPTVRLGVYGNRGDKRLKE